MDWLWFVLLGFLVGGMSGFFGVGGGVLLVPLLVYIMDFKQKEAQGTSLAVLAVPVVIFAALRYYQRGYIQLPVVGWIILGFVVGSILAAEAVEYVPSGPLQRGFGVFLLYMGVVFLFGQEQRTRAVLPAAVAALVAALIALVWRRREPKPTPADEEPDYHI